MLQKEEILLIVYFIVVIVLLLVFVLIFFYAFQKRKNKLLLEKNMAQQKYREELANSRIEIQEQALKNVSWELHDNIGQLLSVAKMQLNILNGQLTGSSREQVLEIGDIVGSSLEEVRSLSKSLNSEMVEHLGLENSIRNELERFERMNVLKISLLCKGEKTEIDTKKAIILFRILQEFFSNVLKHARAKTLLVVLNYKPESLEIRMEDDGIGFDMEEIQKSSGLINMKSRAKMIGAEFCLASRPGEGTKMFLTCQIKN